MKRPTLMRHDRFSRRALIATAAGTFLAATTRAARSDPATVQVAYPRWTEPQPTISLLDKMPPDDGLAGAKLAMRDNDTTGRFMNQRFELSDTPIRADDDPVAILATLTDRGVKLILTDVPADRLLKLAAAGRANGVVLLNIRAPDDALRQQDCRDNVIHVAPSRSMLADAVAQYLVWKKWSRWVLVYGSHRME